MSTAAIGLLAAALAGCGATRGGGSATTIDESGRVTVSMDEYLFEPQDITSPTGGMRVRVTNDGSLAHNWRVMDGEEQVAGTETFQGDAERTISLDLDPGTYRLVCTVGNHEDLGMAGTLVIDSR